MTAPLAMDAITQAKTVDDILALLPDRLHETVFRQAEVRPDAPAVSDPERSLSFAQFAQAVREGADLLERHGVRPGDRVALINENSVTAAAMLLAVSAAGGVVSPINARVSQTEIAAMCATLEPRLTVYTIESPAARAQADAAGATPVDTPVGALALSRTASYEPDDGPPPAVIMFTSGTTGRPKGVMLSHRAILYQGASQACSRKVTAADSLYIVAPLSHAIGFGSNLVTCLVSGAEAVLVPRFDPAALARDIAGGRISFMVAVPQVYAKLLDFAAAHGIALGRGRMRFTGTGGATVDPALIERMQETFGLPFGNAYGCTEMTPIARVPDGMKASGAAIGIAAPGCAVRVAREDGSEAETGEVGELWARGPSRMEGYFRNPAATAEAITPEGWLRTGDLARVDADGALYIVGRAKEMIIRSGFNVYPAEVEAVLATLPGVVQSAVLGRAVEGDEEIVAFVQPAAGATLDPEALRAACREKLAGYKVPQDIHVQDLPIGPTGKILKSALAAQLRG
jgi:long-chain acyl-CoA synthetase